MTTVANYVSIESSMEGLLDKTGTIPFKEVMKRYMSRLVASRLNLDPRLVYQTAHCDALPVGEVRFSFYTCEYPDTALVFTKNQDHTQRTSSRMIDDVFADKAAGVLQDLDWIKYPGVHTATSKHTTWSNRRELPDPSVKVIASWAADPRRYMCVDASTNS